MIESAGAGGVLSRPGRSFSRSKPSGVRRRDHRLALAVLRVVAGDEHVDEGYFMSDRWIRPQNHDERTGGSAIQDVSEKRNFLSVV